MMKKNTGKMTAREGRRFGLTVGTAFLVFAGIASWRGHPTTTLVLGSLGSAFALGGLLLPTYMGPVERAWMRLALLMSKVTTPIVMAAMYLLVLTPVGFLRRTFGGNPMTVAEQNGGYWQSRRPGSRAGNMQRQF